jgi:hypothetical protein
MTRRNLIVIAILSISGLIIYKVRLPSSRAQEEKRVEKLDEPLFKSTETHGGRKPVESEDGTTSQVNESKPLADNGPVSDSHIKDSSPGAAPLGYEALLPPELADSESDLHAELDSFIDDGISVVLMDQDNYVMTEGHYKKEARALAAEILGELRRKYKDEGREALSLLDSELDQKLKDIDEENRITNFESNSADAKEYLILNIQKVYIRKILQYTKENVEKRVPP